MWESSSASTSTESTSDASGTSATTGYISIPERDSSIDGNGVDIVEERCVRLRQKYRGQLRIDINMIGNFICSHIFAARNVLTESRSRPNCFVTITILPESRVHGKCISTVYQNSSRPVYDEKISMELPINFQSKRLFVRLWHVRPDSRKNELLGSMSFGLHAICTRTQLASGWYYVLDEDQGRVRHVRLLDNVATLKNYEEKNVSKLLLCRDESGCFGISITKSLPAKISRVSKGSTAELHDIRPGDIILAIDKHDVRSLEAIQVAQIIRSVKVFACVVIQRGPDYEIDKHEDKVRNGIVARFIKRFYYNAEVRSGSRERSGGTSKNVIVDYGWLDHRSNHFDSEGEEAWHRLSSSSLVRSGSLPCHGSARRPQLHRDDVLRMTNSSRSRWPLPSAKRLDLPEGWHQVGSRNSEPEEFECKFHEGQFDFYGSKGDPLTPVTEGNSSLHDSSFENRDHCERSFGQETKRNCSTIEEESFEGDENPTDSYIEESRDNDSRFAYDNPSLNNEDCEYDEHDGNIAVGPSRFDICENEQDSEDDHKENAPLILNTPQNSNKRLTQSHKMFLNGGIQPLTPCENILPNGFCDPSSLGARSGLPFCSPETPSAFHRGHKGKASRMQTTFKNRHAS